MSVDSGEFEAYESYFGARRVRGKRGRGAAGKTPVFGLLKRGGKVFVKAVENCSREELMPVIQGKVLEGFVIHADGWKAYDGLVLNGYDYYRVFHSRDEFAKGKSQMNAEILTGKAQFFCPSFRRRLLPTCYCSCRLRCLSENVPPCLTFTYLLLTWPFRYRRTN